MLGSITVIFSRQICNQSPQTINVREGRKFRPNKKCRRQNNTQQQRQQQQVFKRAEKEEEEATETLKSFRSKFKIVNFDRGICLRSQSPQIYFPFRASE